MSESPLVGGLDHLQIEVPAGHEAQARAFYGGRLGLPELGKPETLKPNGGVWFLLPDGVQLHTGVVADHAPRPGWRAAYRAPASSLKPLLALPGALLTGQTVLLSDPTGNRLEVLVPGGSAAYPDTMTDPAAPLISGLDHVQIEAPTGHDAEARRFYGAFLGLPELPRPQGIAHIPGLWFGLPDGRTLHTGEVQDFSPRDKGHPCFAAPDLDRVMAKAKAEGVPVSEDFRLAPVRRAFLRDPFGNRVEVVMRPETR